MYAKSAPCSAQKRSGLLIGGTISVSIIVLLILAHNQLAASMPTPAEDSQTSTTRLTGNQSGKQQSESYKHTDEQLQAILERLKADEKNLLEILKEYVSEGGSLDQLRAFIELALVEQGRLNAQNNAEEEEEEELHDVLDETESTTTKTTTITTTEATPITTEAPITYVETDEEFEQILDRLSGEAVDCIMHPLNYVTNDEDLDKVVAMIARGEVEKLHERWLNNRDLFADAGECPICQQEMGTREAETKLACGHLFHKECLDDWLSRKSNCPLCRREVH